MLSDEIINNIDSGIVDLVILVNDLGMKTMMSCQGGEGHSFEYPILGFETFSEIDNKNLLKDLKSFFLKDTHYLFRIIGDIAYQVYQLGDQLYADKSHRSYLLYVQLNNPGENFLRPDKAELEVFFECLER